MAVDGIDPVASATRSFSIPISALKDAVFPLLSLVSCVLFFFHPWWFLLLLTFHDVPRREASEEDDVGAIRVLEERTELVLWCWIHDDRSVIERGILIRS
jgi:hypothetical protein